MLYGSNSTACSLLLCSMRVAQEVVTAQGAQKARKEDAAWFHSFWEAVLVKDANPQFDAHQLALAAQETPLQSPHFSSVGIPTPLVPGQKYQQGKARTDKTLENLLHIWIG